MATYSISLIQDLLGAKLSGTWDEFHTEGGEFTIHVSGCYTAGELQLGLQDLQEANSKLQGRTPRKALLDAARPLLLRGHDDVCNVFAYDTDEHDDALNTFTELARQLMTTSERDTYDAWCLKATTEEICGEALKILGIDP